jgi:hypothetical protein
MGGEDARIARRGHNRRPDLTRVAASGESEKVVEVLSRGGTPGRACLNVHGFFALADEREKLTLRRRDYQPSPKVTLTHGTCSIVRDSERSLSATLPLVFTAGCLAQIVLEALEADRNHRTV